MNEMIICSTGDVTEIWNVNSTLQLVSQFEIGSLQSRAVDWTKKNNYVLICSSQGDMYLRSIAKDTTISLTKSEGNMSLPFSCSILLTGNRYVVTGDSKGNIRMWPVQKTCFDKAAIDVTIPDCSITSVVEFTMSCIYASTNKGQVFEVNFKSQQVSLIYTVDNDIVLSMIKHANNLYISTATGRVYKLMPLLKNGYLIYTTSPSQQLYLSYSFSPLLNGIVCYGDHTLILLNLKTNQPFGFIQTESIITAADINNDLVVIATENHLLSLWNIYDLTQPIFTVTATGEIRALRFGYTTSSEAILSRSFSSIPIQSDTNTIFSQTTPIPKSPLTPPRIQTNQSPFSSPISSVSSSTSGIQQEITQDSIMLERRTKHSFTPQRMSNSGQRESVQYSPSIHGSTATTTSTATTIQSPTTSAAITSSSMLRKENDEWKGAIREVIYPLVQEMQTYVHREVCDLRSDLVRQFFEQERIINEQREQIEQLVQLLQQRRSYFCLLIPITAGLCISLISFVHL